MCIRDSNRDGTYSVTTTYRVENRGTTVLENLRLVEGLDEIYPGLPARLVGAESPDVTTVEVGETRRDFELVAFGEQLETGETATVSSSVVVTPGNALGPFQTSARAIGISPAGTELVRTPCLKKRSCSSNGPLCCLLYTSPSPRDATLSRMPSSA